MKQNRRIVWGLCLLVLLWFTACGETPTEPSADHSVITVGVFENSMTRSSTEKLVAFFNEEHTDIQAEIIYYADANRLNMSFLTGDQPDIVNFDGYTATDELYVQKDYLCDLYAFLDSDEELRRTDFIPSYLTCAQTQGGLYSLATEFHCRTLVAPTEYVGDSSGWTFAEFADVVEQLPPEMDVMAFMTKLTFLQVIIEQTISEFVDLPSGTCNYTCQEFYDLLTICNTYFPENEGQAGTGTIADGTALLETAFSMGGFSGLVNAFMEYQRPVTAIGYPGASGNGAVLYWYDTYGITAYSDQKESAWEFIKWAVSDAYQSQVVMAIPVSQGEFDKRLAELERDKTIDPAALEQALDLLYGAAERTQYQSELVNIVTEEAATFFANDQSVEHAAEVIQDRTELYLAEIA